MKRTVLLLFLVPLLVLSLQAQSSQPAAEGFTWNGELVSLDETGRTVTVKSPVYSDQAIVDFGRLKAGDKVLLTWSGFDKYADSIRAVRLMDAKKSEDRFTLPADFVAFDSGRKYATFKVQIPQHAVAKLKSIKPGEWVTATSPHGASSQTSPIVSIRHYNDVSDRS